MEWNDYWEKGGHEPGEAWEDVRRRIRRRVVFRVRNESLADDIVQETLLQAIRRFAGFRGEGSLEGWLMAIAGNLYRRHVENEQRMRRHALAKEVMRTICVAEPEKQVPEEAVRDLRRELAALPAALRESLEASYFRHLSYAEAAAFLGIELTTHRMRVYRAKRILAKRLEKYKDLF